MRNAWSAEIGRIALLLFVVLLGGLISGAWLELMLLALVLYLARHLYRLSRLVAWLQKGGRLPLADAGGIWSEVYYGLHRLQERHRRRKRRLSEIVNRFQESTHAMPDAIVVLNRDGAIEWFNPVAERWLGLRSPQDVGQRIDNLVRHPEFSAFLQGEEYGEALTIPSPLDGGRTLQIRAVPYGREQRLLVVRDLTRLQRLEQVRRDFVANVSHELRTPLTVVGGYLEALSDSGDECAARWSKQLGQMREQSRRMQHIVDDLLMLARLERDDERPAPAQVDVPALLDRVRRETATLSGSAGHEITLEVEEGLCLRGNEQELHSAFTNLAANAVRYTPAGGAIRMRWFAGEGGAHFEVSDTGIGIPARHIPRLTERFYRVDAGRSRASGGTGLGLAIVKYVLQRHGAKLDIESTPGRGSTFRCDFPAEALLRRDGPAPKSS